MDEHREVVPDDREDLQHFTQRVGRSRAEPSEQGATSHATSEDHRHKVAHFEHVEESPSRSARGALSIAASDG